MEQEFNARITQIVKWEERERYFRKLDYPEDGEYDVLLVTSHYTSIGISSCFANWCKGFVGKALNVPFVEFPIAAGLPIVTPRPHDFKVGDEVTLKIELTQRKV